MGLSLPRRSFLVAHFGEEFAANLERRLKALSTKLEREGVSYKEMSDCLDGLCASDKGGQHALSPDRRQFLARFLGEERTKAIEACEGNPACASGLAEKERQLVEGIGYKQGEMVMAPASPFAGAMSWADLAAAEALANVQLEVAHLWDVFGAVASNIRTSDKPMPEKTRLLKAAVAEFIRRIGEVKGVKAMGTAGARVEIAALLDEFDKSAIAAGQDPKLLKAAVQTLIESLRQAAGTKAKGRRDPYVGPFIEDLTRPRKPVNAKAMKELEALGDPVAGYLADLVAGRVVRGD